MESFRGASVCPSARAMWKEILKGDTTAGSRGVQTDGAVCCSVPRDEGLFEGVKVPLTSPCLAWDNTLPVSYLKSATPTCMCC